MNALVVSSTLGVGAQAYWDGQSMATLNRELGPWIRMSAPAQWRQTRLTAWGGKSPLFKSWILFLGLLPLDRHTFGAFDFGPRMRFVECSSSWLNRAWRHERTMLAAAGGYTLTDTIEFTPRLALLAPVLKVIYGLVFRHRHSRLLALYPVAGT